MKTAITWVSDQLGMDARAWKYPASWNRTIILLPLATTAIIAALALLANDPDAAARPLFRWITAEDGVIEWLQFACIAATAVLAAVIGRHLLRSGATGFGRFFGLIALGAVFIAGEEISWGQRLFGWSTPEALDAINKQGESTIHNIGIVQHTFMLLIFCAAMYGAFVPLARAVFGGDQPRSAASLLLVPPLAVVPAFMVMFGYRLVRMTLWEESDFIVVKFGEMVELSFYFGVVMFAALTLRRLRRSAADELKYAPSAATHYAGEAGHRAGTPYSALSELPTNDFRRQ